MYDFLNLSPNEFEKLCGQLLEKKFQVELEFFTEGVDGGIDFRYSKNKDNDLIIQVKRYKNFSDLKKSLKREYDKVIKLNPKRYVIATSLGLTPGNKDSILEIFKGVKLRKADIIGKEQLEKYLLDYPQVLKNNFKLWLSSTEVLKHLLSNKIYTYSNFNEENIKNDIKLFVESDSVKKAYDILKKERFLIISGLPGVGKSTLSRMITYRLLDDNFDELVYISSSISEAFEVYDPNKKQIFVFDDFLGQNFLEPTLPTNEETRIVDFAKLVAKNDKDVLIYVTREYILQQAKNKLEKLNRGSFELNKFILDISEYTNMEKAEILYNHLFFSTISRGHITAILKNKAYKAVINHSNYNPRLIEGVVELASNNNIKAKDFSQTFLNYLDKPALLWSHVFENQISALSQNILLLQATFGSSVYLEDLEQVVSELSEDYKTKYNFAYNPIDFKKAIKELETTFIKTNLSHDLKSVVTFSNPSIRDFLVSYLNDNSVLKMDLTLNAYSYEQLIKNVEYSTAPQDDETVILIYGEDSSIKFSVAEETEVINRLITLVDESPKLSVFAYTRVDTKGEQKQIWEYSEDSVIVRLNEITNAIGVTKNSTVSDYVSKKLSEYDWVKLDMKDLKKLSNIFKIHASCLDNINFESLVTHVRSSLKTTQEIVDYIYFEKYLPEKAFEYIDKEGLKSLMKEVVKNECSDLYSVDLDELELLKNNVEEIFYETKIEFSTTLAELEEVIEDENTRIQSEAMEDFEDYDRTPMPWEREGREIDEMFGSLKS